MTTITTHLNLRSAAWRLGLAAPRPRPRSLRHGRPEHLRPAATAGRRARAPPGARSGRSATSRTTALARPAYVILPASYGPGHNPAAPARDLSSRARRQRPRQRRVLGQPPRSRRLRGRQPRRDGPPHRPLLVRLPRPDRRSREDAGARDEGAPVAPDRSQAHLRPRKQHGRPGDPDARRPPSAPARRRGRDGLGREPHAPLQADARHAVQQALRAHLRQAVRPPAPGDARPRGRLDADAEPAGLGRPEPARQREGDRLLGRAAPDLVEPQGQDRHQPGQRSPAPCSRRSAA